MSGDNLALPYGNRRYTARGKHDSIRDDFMNELEQLQLFEREGLRWLKQERLARYPAARQLTTAERSAMRPFFPEEILLAARIQHVPVIPNPDFYAALRAKGEPIPLDFSSLMAGLALVDCILIAESKVGVGQLPLDLLFHELVHVVQYRLLGPDEFIHRYVYGWAMNGRDYDRIPFEIQANNLEARYAAAPGHAFSVEDLVRANLPA